MKEKLSEFLTETILGVIIQFVFLVVYWIFVICLFSVYAHAVGEDTFWGLFKVLVGFVAGLVLLFLPAFIGSMLDD